MKPVFSRSWVDQFGTACIHVEGGTGQKTVLLLCPLESSQAVFEILKTLPAFKGRITLAVLEAQHSAPVRAIVQHLAPQVIIALDASSLLSSGDGFALEPQTYTSRTGLEYHENGVFTAWHSSLGIAGSHGQSVLASAAQTQAVLACSAVDLADILQQVL